MLEWLEQSWKWLRRKPKPSTCMDNNKKRKAESLPTSLSVNTKKKKSDSTLSSIILATSFQTIVPPHTTQFSSSKLRFTKKLLYQKKSSTRTVVAKQYGFELTLDQLRCLCQQEWLNDSVRFYYTTIMLKLCG